MVSGTPTTLGRGGRVPSIRERMRRLCCTSLGLYLSLLGGDACTRSTEHHVPSSQKVAPPAPQPPPHHVPIVPPQSADTPPMTTPVPLWEHGKVSGQIDAATAASQGYVVLDLGEAWVPYIFTDGSNDKGKPLKNDYRETYLALARGEFPNNYHGERAKDDKYLELYGIAPTFGLIRERFRHFESLECLRQLDQQPLITFQGVVIHETNEGALKIAADFGYLRGVIDKLMRKQRVKTPEELDPNPLDDKDKDRLKHFFKIAPEYYAVDATQKRLKCEGFFKGKRRYVRGALDSSTRDALVEFERRHRVFGWGLLGKDTLEVLRLTPAEAERKAVMRVLLERAIHAASVLEDGSVSADKDGQPHTFKGADGKDHPLPNLTADLEQRLTEAFGLQTAEATFAWLEGLGKLPPLEHRFVAFRGPTLPEYYDGDMELTLEYDRGDVWFDFPYDDRGREIFQPVSRRPNVTVYTRYLDQKIPLARYGTTIGGWRSELVGETLMWKYKESPVGPRVWSQIVASPVWMPPDTTPPKDLLKRPRLRKPGDPPFEVNYYETGPGYASAYGLVAAYHRKYLEHADGSIDIGQDEGIRTHGSVDYMSIMRRHSHGCHRLHNHIAVRLMSFVLGHRPHRRLGQEQLGFQKLIEWEDQKYQMELKQGGYVFELDTPLKVHVFEGRIRGQQKRAIEIAIPKYDDKISAYVTPDGGAVQVRGDRLIDIPMPERPDAGVVAPFEAAADPKRKAPTFFSKPEG
jgi:hypothetical protein